METYNATAGDEQLNNTNTNSIAYVPQVQGWSAATMVAIANDFIAVME